MDLSLPTLDFSKFVELEDSSDGDIPDFDVYDAAKKQRRPRNSILINSDKPFSADSEAIGITMDDLTCNDENKSANVRNMIPFSNNLNDSGSTKKSSLRKNATLTSRSAPSPAINVANTAKANKVYKTTRNVKANIRLQPSVKIVVKKAKTEPKVPLRVRSASLTAPAAKKNRLSSEELELQRIEEEKRKIQEEMEKYQKAYRRGSGGSVSKAPVRVVPKALTVPKTPIKSLTSRLGKKCYSINGVSEETMHHLQEKSEDAGHIAHSAHLSLTQPEPFSLETDKRAKARGTTEQPHSEYHTVAELEQKFMRDPRSHDVPQDAAKHLTEPVTPNLLTTKRARVSTCYTKSREQLDEEEMHSHVFKARPVDKRVLQGVAAPKPSVKPLTEPQPFQLRIDRRSSLRASMTGAVYEPEPFVFKALPLPDTTATPAKLLQSPRAPPPAPLTRPISPKSFKNRQSMAMAPSGRQLPHHSEVEQLRQLEYDEYKQSMTQHAPMTAQKQFRVTEPKEFNLRTSKRGEAYRQHLEEGLKRQQEEEKTAREVHAKPVPKLKKFQPTPCKKQLTDFEEFSLRSVVRHAAVKRIQEIESQQSSQTTQPTEKKSFQAKRVKRSCSDMLE